MPYNLQFPLCISVFQMEGAYLGFLWISPDVVGSVVYGQYKLVLFYAVFPDTAHHSRDAATGFAAVAMRSRVGCWSMEDRRRPYQPKRSPSKYQCENDSANVHKCSPLYPI